MKTATPLELLKEIIAIANNDEPDHGHGFPRIKNLGTQAIAALEQQAVEPKPYEVYAAGNTREEMLDKLKDLLEPGEADIVIGFGKQRAKPGEFTKDARALLKAPKEHPDGPRFPLSAFERLAWACDIIDEQATRYKAIKEDWAKLEADNVDKVLEIGGLTATVERLEGASHGDSAIVMIEQLQSQLAALRWKSVGEGLPENEEADDVLFMVGGTVEAGEFKNDLFWATDGESFDNVTHWMPIPKLPEKGGKG